MSMKLSTIPEHFNPEIEDRLGYLHLFDTAFLIDDSISMTKGDPPPSTSRWDEAKMMLAILAQIAARHDQDGIDVHFLNHPKSFKGLKTTKEVAAVFKGVKPIGGTPTATKLDQILGEYFDELQLAMSSTPGSQKRWSWFRKEKKEKEKERKPVKPLNLIVITDGRPFPQSEEPDDVIRKYMSKLDKLGLPKKKRQIGIMFAQVGHDRHATQHLQELDDMAKGNERDMVDTFKCNLSDVRDDDIATLAKLLLGAIVPEIDGMISAKFTESSHSDGETAMVSSTSKGLLMAPPAYGDACASSSSSATAATSALYDDQKKSDFHSSY
ncbi:hypothetical protein SCHPADRAFT_941427 [Schizopora paradoxa]|uniref:VWFA domain-containing protein n=1 Tax=Schizopora paradoxa TaxID=27342 RepID=A0A0H2S5F0_9AGAM|nr:hypothetical protein SCHPADRAFT_941427 [Schizopora paradoxa]